jgi:hypothetical protein
MGLLDDLTPKKIVHPCLVRTVAGTLDPSDATIFVEAVVNPAWSFAGLEAALAEKGISVSRFAIKQHRTKLCSCGKLATDA